MTFPYELTYEEYVETAQAAGRVTGETSRVPTLVGLGFFALSFVLLFARPDRGGLIAPLLLMALATFTAIYPIHIAHSSFRRLWTRYRASRPSCTLTITDEHIIWTSDLTRFEIAWPDFERTVETRRLILLARTAGDLAAIPKRAFPSPQALDEFRSLLIQKFPPKARGFPVIPRDKN